MQPKITWQDRDRAHPMPLAGGPVTPAAIGAVEDVLTNIVVSALAQPPRPRSLEKYRLAVGALLSDLLRYRATGADGKHGMSPKDFPSRHLGFGRDIFMPVKEALVDGGYIQFVNGWNHTGAGFAPGSMVRWGGDTAFFRLAPSLIQHLGPAATEPWGDHWTTGKPKAPENAPRLLLRARKLKGEATGRPLPIEPGDARAALLLRDVEVTNSFLATKRIEGIAFVGLRRIFNDGDQPGMRWERGGRYYSLPGGDKYEMMGGEARRCLIRLDGEPVAEVDISASHLTVLYAVHGIAFDASDTDPYETEGIHRAAAKAWVTSALGDGTAGKRIWSPRSCEMYAEDRPGRSLRADYQISDVRAAVIRRHPMLHELAEDAILSIDLQWHESEILRIAMYELREQGVPSLPVHDSLIVPASKVDVTQAALRRGFIFHFEDDRVVPRLTVKGPTLT